jgi:hypothetical protein
MDPIAEEFGQLAIRRGGIYMYGSADALKVIQACKRLNLRI